MVYEEHGLKEHAFAQYLPQVPEPGKPAVNELGLTFVFAKKYREYLPPYCDDVVAFDETGMSLTPRAR